MTRTYLALSAALTLMAGATRPADAASSPLEGGTSGYHLASLRQAPQTILAVASGGDPTGLNTDDLNDLASGEYSTITRTCMTFGEKLVPQTQSAAGDHDLINGAPTAALTIDPAVAPAFALNILTFGSQVIDGCGPAGCPAGNAIGEGAVSVLFVGSQKVISFTIVGSDGGNIRIRFYDNSATLIGDITEAASDGVHTFTSTATDIRAIVIVNDDPAGIGYDDFRYLSCVVDPPTGCDLSPIEAKLDDETRFTSDAELATIEAKLDDGSRFTSNVELNTAVTNLTTEINANETKINALEAKLDDGTRFTSDAERNAQTTTLTTEINQNETKINSVEAKLDDETRFTSDAELLALETSLTTEINQNEAAIAVVEAKLDAAIPAVQEALCAVIDLLLTPERRRCSDTMSCGFGFFPSGLESVNPPACATAPNSGQFAPTSGFTADTPAPTSAETSIARGGTISAEVIQAAALSRSSLNSAVATALRGNEVDLVFVMPAANGGALDQVAAFVTEAVRFQKGLTPAAEGLFRAEDAYAEAERLRKEGRYPQAYLRYRDAYRGLVALLQNVTSASTTTTTTTE